MINRFIKNQKKFITRIILLLTIFIFSGFALLGNCEDFKACTVNCTTCGGDGFVAYCAYCDSNSKDGNNGATCNNCSIGTLQRQMCKAGCDVGKVWTACTEGSWVTTTANGF